MAGVQEEFQQATARAKTLPEQSNDVLLQLYGLFKQATAGDVSGDEPGMFDFVGRAKYDAWATRRGMSRDEAMKAYVALVNTLAGGPR
ncbi:MAG: acyl-CoA-binding protein [Acidobacteriota bacterium]